MQAPVPEQAPLQPVNSEPVSGLAESATLLPTGKAAEQLLPQSIPAGSDVTLPAPEPVRLTLRFCCSMRSPDVMTPLPVALKPTATKSPFA